MRIENDAMQCELLMGKVKALNIVLSPPSLWKPNTHILAKRANILAIIWELDSLDVPRAARSNDVKNIHRIKRNIMFQTQLSCTVQRQYGDGDRRRHNHHGSDRDHES